MKHAPALASRKRHASSIAAIAACLLAQTAQSAPPAPVIAPTAAMEAHRTVTSWIRSTNVPADPPSIDLEGVTAVSVTLRRSGRVIGRGTEVASPNSPAEALQLAASQAWIEASEQLREVNDALHADRLSDAVQALTIDLELAGQWTPIGGASFADASRQVSPGIEGVGARVGGRLVAVFPGTMHSSNRTAGQAMLSASGALDLPPLPLLQLRTDHNLVVYRYPVTRLAQIDPLSAPIFLFRGGRITPASDVTSASLNAFADQLARNILSRHWPSAEPLGLMDTIRPWMGGYADPVVASPRSQSLAILALTRWSSLSAEPEVRFRTVRALLSELAAIDETETDPATELTSAAMTLYTINESLRSGVWKNQALPSDLNDLRTRCRSAVETGIGAASTIDPPVLALVVCAAATDDSFDRSEVEQVIRSLFRDAPPQELPALSPWLGWAEIALHEEDARLPSTIALREHRSILWRHQISSTGVGADEPDLLGGIVFTASRHPEPNWQTARALALIATMLGDDRLTKPDERLPEIVNLTRSIRFLMELAIDETDAALVPITASTGVGAVRMSLTDQRAPLDAAAMTLLTTCETINAFDRVKSGR